MSFSQKNMGILLTSVVILLVCVIAIGVAFFGGFDGFGSIGRGTREAGVPETDIWVQRIEGLDDDFMLGVDISSVLSLEESGVIFRDFDGNEADLFELFATGGANYVRVRIWNDPWYHGNHGAGDGTRRGFGGGNNDVSRAIEIGRRATDAGMSLLVNFHYSDFWADPGKQMAPRAWEGMSVAEKAVALYDFTYDTIMQMLVAGIDIGMVQIGNETNNGIAGVTGWPFKVQLFAAGSEAVIAAERDFRISQGESLSANFIETERNIRIAFHKTDPENFWTFTQTGLTLQSAEVVYDVFGISYYPFWHGCLDNLVELMNLLANTFDVDVAVFETSYPFTTEDSDGHTNSWSGYMATYNYPITTQGQAHAIRDVAAAVASVERGVGIFLWEPAWITVGHGGREANLPIWEEFGSGWAASYAAVYDPYDAGTYWGGSSWDNQAFFDRFGYPIATLNLFNYLRTGAVSRHGNRIDMILHSQSEALRNPGLTMEYLVENMLPETVIAVFANNARVPARVIWEEADLQVALEVAQATGGVATVEIRGLAMTKTADEIRAAISSDDAIETSDDASDNMEATSDNTGVAEHGATGTVTSLDEYSLWQDLDYGHSFYFTHTLTLSPGNLVENHSFEDPNMDMWRVIFHGTGEGYANRGMDNPRSGDFGFRFWRGANLPIHFSIEQDILGLTTGLYGFEAFITGGDAGTGWEIYAYVLINGELFARENSALPGWQNWNNPGITNIPVQDGDIITVGITFNIENTNGAWGTVDDFFFYAME